MKKYKHIIIPMVLMFSLVLSSCGIDTADKNTPIEVVELRGSYAIDVNDTRCRVGFADYVFVGEIIEVIGTEYRHHELDTEGNIIEETGSPYTEYKVKVIENIKGELTIDKEIVLYQAGGLSFDNSAIHVYEDDKLMASEKTYIIETSVQSDGSLLASGPNNNTEISRTARTSLSKNEKYSSYVDDANNEIIYERKRFDYQ